MLHKGADSFMSEADFKTFYWPTLKKVMNGIIEQGIVPAMFAEGAYNKRLHIINDPEIPTGSALWMYDQTDMASAKQALRGHSCISGNVPTALTVKEAGAPPAQRADAVAAWPQSSNSARMACIRRAARPRCEMRFLASAVHSPRVRPPGGSTAGSKIGS